MREPCRSHMKPPFHSLVPGQPSVDWPQKDSHLHRFIMDLSWPDPFNISVNGCTPKEVYRGHYKKMHLPMATNIADLIWQAGKDTYLFCCDITRAYCQLPLDPGDWPLICLKAHSRYVINVNLSLHSACGSCCQDITTLIVRALKEEGTNTMAYIDDLRGWWLMIETWCSAMSLNCETPCRSNFRRCYS